MTVEGALTLSGQEITPVERCLLGLYKVPENIYH
jgi:hypothetical protein